MQKLGEKGQTSIQSLQAADAIKFYFELQKSVPVSSTLGAEDSNSISVVSAAAMVEGKSDEVFLKHSDRLASPRAEKETKPFSPMTKRIDDEIDYSNPEISGPTVKQTPSPDVGRTQTGHGRPSSIGCLKEKNPWQQITKRTAEKRVLTPVSQTGSSWLTEYTTLADEIQVRQYSPKTLKSYRLWVNQFQTFTRSKSPGFLDNNDVKEFLSFLAVRQNVSASSQNQAFNALLFFFRHVLHKEFGKIDGVVRAKNKRRIPVVLSRQEIEAILSKLASPYNLIVKLLYGCGLRLSECLQLRIGCLNFDAGVLTVHDGKGKKDRTVPLPQAVIPEIEAHMETLRVKHQQDLDQGFSGVFLVKSLEKKYPNAPKEFIWQWIFPAKQLTHLSEKGE
ncbi:MAG: phage integrase N-terminal SAM-like domain-containing protein [Candidatus Ozemobacteraceae bacterium]